MDKFIAVAAIVLNGPEDRVCLIRSKKNGRVLTPGGRVNAGETLVEALVREIHEETGLRVTAIGCLMGVDDRPEFTLYVFEAFATGELRAGDDAAEVWWGTADEVRDAEVPRDYPWILDCQKAARERRELAAARRDLALLRAEGLRQTAECADARACAHALDQENRRLHAEVIAPLMQLFAACDGAVRRTKGAPTPEPTLALTPAALRALLAALVREESNPAHGHQRHGRWDTGNPATIADRLCRRCHLYAEARALLGLPRWPSEGTRRAQADEAAGRAVLDGPHDPATCGCGGDAWGSRP